MFSTRTSPRLVPASLGRLACHAWLLVAVAMGVTAGTTHAQALRLQIHPTSGQGDVALNEVLPGRPELRPTRLDFLLSGLAFRRKDGTWLQSQDWYAYLSATSKMTAEGTGTPPGDYTALRFRIGVDEAANQADPHQHPPGHALNPQTNGLHWGLMGGYIFLALEGRWQNGGKDDGFSFHLANAPQLMTVEVPMEFQGGRPLTLELDLDLPRALEGIDLKRDGTSTHSRAGDPLAAKLKHNLEQAFRARRVSYDVFQTLALSQITQSLSRPAGTHAFTPEITQRFPQVKLPADNPLTQEGVALGRRLFHDARLSINGTQSCASCHDQAHAFADPRPFSIGAKGRVGTRNAMPLFNLAWHQAFFWDGRAPTLRQQVLIPISDAHEMNETPQRVCDKLRADAACAEAFAKAFGSPGVTPERLALALEQFLLTLVSQNSRYDRAARKLAELTESEKRGLQLFVTEFDPQRGLRGADCFHCHGGTLFASQPFGNNGLLLKPDDVGQMAVTQNEADRGKFKVPSLRNIALTAPYMHDGRFTTLEQVVEHYSTGVRRGPTLDPNLAKHPEGGLQLTAEEKADLVAFLKTLTDETFVETPKATAAAEAKAGD